MDWKNLIRGKITFCITAGFAAYSGVQYALTVTHILLCISADWFSTIPTDFTEFFIGSIFSRKIECGAEFWIFPEIAYSD